MAAPTPVSRGTDLSKGVVPAEWPGQAADTIVETIDKVRDKTTKPAIVAVRALVYGVIVVSVAIVALVLLTIVLFRVLGYLPGNIWTVYAAFGVVFSIAGLVMLRKANRPVTAEA